MTSDIYSKKNISSVNVLKTLLLLLEDNYTMNELVKKLNSEEKFFVFNNNTVSKYINTCRYCGIKIYKFCNKYTITHLPFGLNFEQSELDLFEYMQKISTKIFTNKSSHIFNKFIERINKFSNKYSAEEEKMIQKTAMTIFENAIETNRKTKLYFKVQSAIKCTPVSIIKKGEEVLFNVIYKDKEKSIKSSKISCVELIDDNLFSYIEQKSVVFRLFNGLETRYTLKENEKLVNSKPGEITVSCLEKDKDILFSRLIRYDYCCEILYPVSYREEFKEIIKNMLNNYEV